MNSRIIVAMLAAVVMLAGCAGGVRNWKEQVILPDGRELIVERTHTLASRFDREFSAFNAPPGAASYSIRIPLPEGGYTAPWAAEHKEMYPIAVTTHGESAYVLATPSFCRSYAKHGQPIPPFLAFKYTTGQWQRVAFEDFPMEITEANLMIDTSDKETEKGLVTARAIRRLNEINPDRKIYQQGINRYIWGGCLEQLKAGWHSSEQTKPEK